MGIFSSTSNNNYFSSYIDIKAISTPSNPNSGIGRIFHRSSDNKLCFKLSNGTVVELGGGAGTVTTASNVGSGSGWFKTLNGTTLEFKSLIAGSNQLSITSNTNDLTVDVVEANIKLDDLGAPDDNTDLDSTTLKHGLLPKLGGGSTNFLRADGTWAAPPGASGGEANTYSSAGAGGVGITLTKVGVDLPFKSINTANSSNITVTDDAGNSEIDIDIGADVMTASSTHTMTNKTFNADGTGNSISNIENADIKAAAGIVYSKLTLTDSIVNADINSAAAIAYSKLSLADSIVNADINSAAAIATSKLADSAILLTTTNTKTVTNKTIDAISNTVENTGSFKYTIFKDGSTYYCRNNVSGAIEVSNSDPLTVLQYPLTNGGSCWVQEGDYELTGAPSVYLDFPTEPLYCEFYMTIGAWLVVPNGFAGTVIRLRNSATQHSTRHKLGVNITESGGSATAVSDWTGILVEATDDTIKGVYDTRIVYANIYFPDIGIKYNNDSTCVSGFLTANFCSNVLIWGPKTAGIDFGMDIAYTLSPDVNGIHRHRFRDVTIQAITGRSDSAVGVRNVRHRDHTFDGVYCADFTTGSTATIHADADSIIIDGGSMTVTGKYTDNSTAQTVKIRDQYRHTQVSRITPGQSGVSIDIVPTGSTNTTSWYNSATTERFWIRKDGGTNEVYLDSVRQASGGALRPIVVRMNDVVGGGAGTVESFRVLTDARLQVFTDKFALLDSGGDHEYNFVTSNLGADRNITLPLLTGNDTLVFQAHTQTLTNKTLTSPIISTISNTGTITLPTATTILVGRDTTDTLTNKTISGASNTISNVPDSALSSNVPLKNAANSFSVNQTITTSANYPLITHRDSSTAADEIGGISFNGNNASASAVQYAGVVASIVANTAGTESGQLKLQTKLGGVMGNAMVLTHQGLMFVGRNVRLGFSETGLTAQRTFTFPDISGEIPVRERLIVQNVAAASAFTPAAGYTTIFFNTDDSKLSIKNSGGTVTPLH